MSDQRKLDSSGPLPVHGEVSPTRELDEPPSRHSLGRSSSPAWASRDAGRILLILHQTAGFGAPRRVWLRPGEQILLGRNGQCDVPLVEDPTVSGTHCRIFWSNEVPRLEDLSSTNGTWLNRQSVVSADLGNGDQLRLGQAEFNVYIEGIPAQPQRHVVLRGDGPHAAAAPAAGKKPRELGATWRSP